MYLDFVLESIHLQYDNISKTPSVVKKLVTVCVSCRLVQVCVKDQLLEGSANRASITNYFLLHQTECNFMPMSTLCLFIAVFHTFCLPAICCQGL